MNGSECAELALEPVDVEGVVVEELLGPVGDSEDEDDEEPDEPDEDEPEEDEPEPCDEDEPEPCDEDPEPCWVVVVLVVVVASGSVYCEPEAEPPPAASAPPATPNPKATTASRQPSRLKTRTTARY